MANFGGLVVVLYGFVWALVRLLTVNEMENYLISELYSSNDNDSHQETEIEEKSNLFESKMRT